MIGGYMGKLLRVDLTKEKITKEELPGKDLLRKYIGGWGLGLRLLMDELPNGVSAIDPENPLIFMTGPLTGTIVPSPTNTTLASLNASTGFTAGRSHSHGFWGPHLKFAGYDGLIIQGAAEKPVYLWIQEGKSEIRDAKKFWGMDSHVTEDRVKEDLGVPKASVAAIGQAGENLCSCASIQNDKNHAFSHAGMGRVMGSKKLKAIAVFGKGSVPVADAKKLKEIASEWTKKAAKATYIARGAIALSDYDGVRATVGITTNNLLSNVFDDFGKGMSKHKITPKPCYGCPIACCYDAEIVSGPRKGFVASLGGGGENLNGATAIMGVSGADNIFYLTDLNDRLGFDSGGAGCSMAVAFEAYEKGLITKEDTDGLELRWGDAKVVEKLLRKVAMREGFGDVLADGPKKAGDRLGLSEGAVHIKGGSMNLHDWRRAWAVLLGQILSGGTGWTAPGADCWREEVDAGYLEKTNPLTPFGKAEEIVKTGHLKFWNDSNGVCWFATWGQRLRYSVEAVSAVTGWDITMDEAKLVGERVTNLERVFNIAHGLTVEDDLNVSPRLTDPIPNGPAKGKSIKPYVEGWVRDYYRLMGWDEKTGKPWKRTLKRLGLQKFEKLVWG